MDIFNSTQTNSNYSEYTPEFEQEAWISLLVACCKSDGNFSDYEINAFSALIGTRKLFNAFNIGELAKSALDLFDNYGAVRIIKGSAKKISIENRPTVFALAVEILGNDGMFSDSDKETLKYVAECFELEQDLAKKIIEVIMIKNKGATVTYAG